MAEGRVAPQEDAGAVELLLMVALLEDGEDERAGEKDAERALALRTDLVGNALRYAIRGRARLAARLSPASA